MLRKAYFLSLQKYKVCVYFVYKDNDMIQIDRRIE